MLGIIYPPIRKQRNLLKRFINRKRLNFKRRHYNSQRVAYYNSIKRHNLKSGPLVSIIVPAYNTPSKYIEPLLDSVFSQGYDDWELIIVDASDKNKCSEYISKRAESDCRITYVKIDNGGIAANTNIGIKKTKGKYIAFLDHDDTLDPDALARSMELFINDSSLDLIYSDEDKISDDGELYFEPHFKPDFSLDMLRSVNYITHFVIVKASIAKKLLIRKGFEGAQDYDFLLRVVDSRAKIGHVAGISYHWRQAENSTAANFSNKKHITNAGIKALREHYERRGINNVSVSSIENRPGFYRANYRLNDKKKRAICINIPNEICENNYIEESIINVYKKNKDVKKYNMVILREISESQKKKYESILYINDIIIPSCDDTHISNLFALAEEEGVFGVTPRVISFSQIYDIGLINYNNILIPLGKNTSPNDFSVFGSHEWSRNVDGFTGNIIATSNNKDNFSDKNTVYELSLKSSQRKVVCGDLEFIKLYSPNMDNKSKKHNFYNDCLCFEFRPVVSNETYIEEIVELEK